MIHHQESFISPGIMHLFSWLAYNFYWIVLEHLLYERTSQVHFRKML